MICHHIVCGGVKTIYRKLVEIFNSKVEPNVTAVEIGNKYKNCSIVSYCDFIY